MMEWINSIITVIAVIIAATITEMVIHGFLVIVTYHHRYRTWRSSLLRTISWASFGKVRTVRTFILILTRIPSPHCDVLTRKRMSICLAYKHTKMCIYIYMRTSWKLFLHFTSYSSRHISWYDPICISFFIITVQYLTSLHIFSC